MAHLIPTLAHSPWVSGPTVTWMQFVLSTPVVCWAAAPFFRRGWRSLVTRALNMWTLIAIGVGAAYIYSVVAHLAPGLFPESMRQHGGSVPVYFEAAAVIIVLVLVGQVLELRARSRTGSAIRALLNLAPPTARLVRDGGTKRYRLNECRSATASVCGLVKKFRLMGASSKGAHPSMNPWSRANRIPVEKNVGDTVTGGTLNGTGSFILEAERVGRDTLLARIVQLVSEAQRSRAPNQSLADRVGGIFVPDCARRVGDYLPALVVARSGADGSLTRS
jgi:Cu+-exporting ATPase